MRFFRTSAGPVQDMNAIQPEHLCSLGLVGWLFVSKFTVCLRHTKATTLTPTWCIMSNLFFLLNLIFRLFKSFCDRDFFFVQIVCICLFSPFILLIVSLCIPQMVSCLIRSFLLTDPQTLSCSGTLAGWHCQTLLWHIPSMHPLLRTTVFTKSNLTRLWFWGTSVLLFLLFFFFVLGFFWFPRHKGAVGETGLAQPTTPPEC